MIEITGYTDKHEYISPAGIRSVVYLMDCEKGMEQMPDNSIDLAVVDPPYGINQTSMKMGGRKTVEPNKSKKWDNSIPDKSYFNKLFRISKNQIIWGGNYFPLPNSQYFAIWDKGETMYGRDFAECEYAWINKGGTRIYKKSPNQLKRIHSTQKPVELYDWIFVNYATAGMTILDTHLGSQSSRIAAQKTGLEFIGFETDKDYFNSGNKRFDTHAAQGRLF